MDAGAGRRPGVPGVREGGVIELPKLFTSRWANRDLAHLACQPVGISRGAPRFPVPYRYKMARELAPSRQAFGIEDPEEL